MLALGAGAAAHVSRGGWAGVRDGDPEPAAPGSEAGLRVASRSTVCGAPRLSPEDHGHPVGEGGEGVDFIREWSIQRKSLAAHMGDVAGRPLLTAGCARQWCELWLDTWAAAHKTDPERFRVERNAKPMGFRYVSDWRTPAASSGGTFTDATPLSALGRAWERVRSLRWRAQVAEGLDPLLAAGEAWKHARAVAEETKTLALRLESVSTSAVRAEGGASELAANVGDEGRALIEDAARGAGNALAWTIEGVASPLLGGATAAAAGALASAAVPYLVVGGAAFVAWRSLK